MGGDSRHPAWVWCVAGALLLASALNYMDRQTLANVAPRILAELSLDEPQYGTLELAFGWAFAAGAIAIGVLADRVDIRWLYPTVLIAWSAVGFATAYATDYFDLLVCRLALGFFEAGHWPCALKTTQRLLPPERRTLGNSVLQSGTAIGAIVTPQIIKLMLTDEPGSWRPVFQWIGSLGTIWVVVWLLLIRGQDLGPIATTSHDGRRATDRSFWQAVFSRPFAVLVFTGIAINVAWHLFRAWLPLFLQNGRGYDESSMLDFNFAYHIATDVGCLSAGFLTAWLSHRGLGAVASRTVTFTACASLAGLSAFIPWIPSGPPLFVTMLLVGAGLLGLFPCNYSFSQDLSQRHQGKITGLLATIIWLVTSPTHVFFGAYVKRTGGYDAALAVTGLLPLVAAVVYWAAWPRRTETRLHFDRVPIDRILSLRHRVLRVGRPPETARLECDADEGTRHYAAILEDEAVACLTLAPTTYEGCDAWQLRGMATDGPHQRKGLGSRLIAHALEDVARNGQSRPTWCNARMAAIEFYRRLGWVVVSEPFEIPEIGPHVRMLLDS